MLTTLNSRQVRTIADNLRLFHPDGGVICVQGLNFHGARARAYCTNDLEAAARQAALWDSEGPLGVYFTLNAIQPDLAGRQAFPTVEHVTRRCWLPVDADPVRRPKEHAKDSATLAERQCAWNLLNLCRGILEDGVGLRGVILADSGNGWHANYPIDLPNDDTSKTLVQEILKGLAARCEGPERQATVGVECYDARRIWPCYGTWKRKGEATPERPHRLTRVLEGPAWHGETAAYNTALLSRCLEMWRWIEETRAQRPAGNVVERARLYLTKLPPALAGRPADPAHGNTNHGHAQTFHVACVLVKGFALTVEQAIDAIQDWNQRCEPPWSEKELRHKLTDAAKRPDPVGELLKVGGNEGFGFTSPPPIGGRGSESESEVPPKTEEFPEPIPASKLTPAAAETWIWEGYLARGGITLLSALWKAGKTTLLTHLLRGMENGGEFCGQKLDPAKVLMIVEESEARWAERRDKIGLKDHVEFLVRPFRAKPKWETWKSFLDYLGRLVQSRKYDLIAIDTLANLWPVRDENDASQVQSALMPLHTIAEKASILLVHHNRKGDGAEATGSRGSGALPGFVDTIVELRRFDPADRQCRKRLLTGYGRWDETPPELVVELSEQGEYTSLGSNLERKANELTKTLLDLLPIIPPGWVFDEIVAKWPGDTAPRRKLIFTALTEGAEKGLWHRDGEGVRGNPHRYWRPQA